MLPVIRFFIDERFFLCTTRVTLGNLTANVYQVIAVFLCYSFQFDENVSVKVISDYQKCTTVKLHVHARIVVTFLPFIVTDNNIIIVCCTEM